MRYAECGRAYGTEKIRRVSLGKRAGNILASWGVGSSGGCSLALCSAIADPEKGLGAVSNDHAHIIGGNVGEEPFDDRLRAIATLDIGRSIRNFSGS